MSFKIEGVVPAMVTPLKEGEREVDLETTEKLVDFLLEKGINGLFILGSFGEGLLLSIKERKKFTEKVINYVNGRVPVIVYVSHMELGKVNELIGHAQSEGADAVASVPPFYYNFSVLGIENYFREMCRHFKDVPIFIYNIPQFTINEINLSILQNLVKAGEITIWPDILTWSVLMNLAILLFFSFLQKTHNLGLTAGAVKG